MDTKLFKYVTYTFLRPLEITRSDCEAQLEGTAWGIYVQFVLLNNWWRGGFNILKDKEEIK